MGVLDKFEKGVERAFSNTFARAFRADLKPVDIASALRIEMDDRITSITRGRTVVPNHFVVELSPGDVEKVDEWGTDEFIEELVSTATAHATDQGYVFVGPVEVALEEDDELKTGQFNIRSASQQVGYRDHAREEVAVENAPEPAEPARVGGLHSQPILDVDGQRYLLTGEVTVLGRGSEADIIVSDTGVSRRHLEIRVTPQGVVATDLGSTNGTFVEGHKIDAATLVDGNSLSIGRTRIIFWAGTSAGNVPSGAA